MLASPQITYRSTVNECLSSAFRIVSASSEDDTANVIRLVETGLYDLLDSVDENIINALRYILGEIIDNITQHSQTSCGYFFAKIDQAKKYVDIAISDMGIGLLGSYINNEDKDILSDIEAIQAANRGI